MPWIKDVFVLARDLVFYDTSSSSSVFPHDLVSDIQSNAGDEVCRLYQALFGTPKLLCQRCSIWPLLCPFSLMKRAGLQNMLWGMWACPFSLIKRAGLQNMLWGMWACLTWEV